MRSPWLLLLTTLPLLLGTVVHADDATRLSVELGWSGAYRVGRWTPLFVTVSHDRPLAAVIEVSTPHAGRQSMRIVQPVTLGPTPTIFCLYFVATFDLELLNIDVRDAERGRLLASLRPFDAPANAIVAWAHPTMAASPFIGVSGRGGWRGPTRPGGTGEHEVGMLAADRLPDTPIGYDAIDLLILNSPDLSRLSRPQQQAIATWVRSGGKLLFWADENAVPDDAPLLEVLPAVVGPNVLLELPDDAVHRLGLPERFTRLRGRSLQPKPGAEPIDAMSVPAVVGQVASIGLGRVAVLPFDASLLLFDDEKSAAAFWASVLASLGFSPVDADQERNRFYVGDGRLRAIRAALEHFGTIEGAGSFDFGTIAWTLLGLMFVVGPLDWFVLKKLNRQPWTWATTTGWIGLVTVGSLYAGQLLRSGELHLRTVRIIEQVDGRCVAARELVAVYSPRTRRYELSVPSGWWQPLPGEEWYSSRGLREEFDFVQSREGNTPLPLRVPIWSLRMLYGQRWIDEPPMIEAELAIKTGQDGVRIVGTVRNLQGEPVELLRANWRRDSTELGETVAPGQAVAVNHVLRPAEEDELSPLEVSLARGAREPVPTGLVMLEARVRSDQGPAAVAGQPSQTRHVVLLRTFVPDGRKASP